MNDMFPDMSKYNITKPSGIALYYIHTDLYPFKHLIETIKNGLDVYKSSYFNIARKAMDNNDFYTESEFMTKGTIYLARVVPLGYYSILIMLVSILEEGFNTICRAYQGENKYDLEYTDIAGQGIERCILYLEKMCGINGIKKHPQWEYIKTIRDIRNKIVHVGGMVGRDKSFINRIDKFKLYVDESGKILFEYDDIIKVYNAIIEFTNDAFSIEPKK